MRIIALTTVLGGAAVLAACATVVPRTAAMCGTYGYVDMNNDNFVTSDEWNAFRAGSYGQWDTNRDGRISRAEFDTCYQGGGFYRSAYYNPAYGTNYWTGFDADNDGYLTSDEYWSTSAWTRADRNRNGRIDTNEWQWWM
ncbi:MAG: hypothetical protein M3Q57_00915 [Pseudomonadota bacterium]|nr:hypothetical protein [Pseudomonadota bacterium]